MTAFLACGRIGWRTATAYRGSYLLTFATLMLQIYLMKTVWTGMYAGREEVDGVTLHTMIAYATLAAVQYTLLNPLQASPIPQRVREGKVAVDLLRPVGFPLQMFASQVGGALSALPAVVVALPFALLVGGAQAPSSTGSLIGYGIALLLGMLVNQLLFLTKALLSFWTLETTGFDMIYGFTAQLLSGTLVPLWFMPGPLKAVAEALPFQATAYTPVAIFLGEVRGNAMKQALGMQLVWVVLLGGLAALVWSRAKRHVVVQGG
ncbi:ABC-2 family transporter protein [Streptomyces sp. NPDC006458]|uniref:ABC transporter permease n=1 Tax=Streptomyces sp. NPDC006458 TaxID=3154302 RepID=UPI0033B9BF0D